MKINFKGFVAVIVLAFASITVLHDFAMVLNGFTFTGYGIATLILVIYVGYLSSSYIEARIKR